VRTIVLTMQCAPHADKDSRSEVGQVRASEPRQITQCAGLSRQVAGAGWSSVMAWGRAAATPTSHSMIAFSDCVTISPKTAFVAE